MATEHAERRIRVAASCAEFVANGLWYADLCCAACHHRGARSCCNLECFVDALARAA